MTAPYKPPIERPVDPVFKPIDLSALLLPGRYSPPLSELDIPPDVSDLVDAISFRNGVPRAYILISLIIAVLGLIGSRTRIAVRNHSEAAVLFGLLCGPSGSRKTTAANVVIDSLVAIDRMERDEHRRVAANYDDIDVKLRMEAELKLWKLRLYEAAKARNTDPLPMPDHLRNFAQGRRPEPPFLEYQATATGLIEAMFEARYGVAVWLDEAASVFCGNGGAQLRSLLLRVFDGGAISHRTQTGGARRIESAAASVLTTTQPALLAKLKLDEADGMAARFLLTLPNPDEIAQKDGPSADLTEILVRIRTAEIPELISLSTSSLACLDRFSDDWTALAGKGRASMESVYLRAPALSLRIALAFHALSAALAGKSPGPQLSNLAVKSACRLMERHFIPSAALAIAPPEMDQNIIAARFLASKLLVDRVPRFVIRAYRRFILGECASDVSMQPAIDLLVEAGILLRYDLRPGVVGRRSGACEVNPLFLAEPERYLRELEQSA